MYICTVLYCVQGPPDVIMYWLYGYIKLLVSIKKNLFYKNDLYSVILTKKILKNIKSSPVMLIWFHKIPCYHLNKRILWKSYQIYTDYLISQKYKKMFSRKIRLVAIPSGFYTLDFYNVWRRFSSDSLFTV